MNRNKYRLRTITNIFLEVTYGKCGYRCFKRQKHSVYRKEINWSFIKCSDVLQSGKYIKDVSLVEDFFIDEIKDYFK